MATWQEALDHAQTETEHDTWDHTGLTGVGGAFAGARVYNSANISITTSGTSQALTFNSERYDTDAYHSTASNTDRLTIPAGKAGNYLITAHVQFAAHGTGVRGLGLNVSGTNIAWHTQPTNSSGTTIMSLTSVYDMAEADYVTVVAFQTSGGSLNVEASGNRSPEFTISKLG